MPLFVALALLLLTSAAHAATVTLSPAAGPTGSKVTLHGAGFPARGKVRVRAAGTLATNVRATGRGAFTARLTIRRAGSTIGVESRAASRRVENIFRIAKGSVPLESELAGSGGERLRWTPTNPVAGSSVAVRGQGLPRSVRVQIELAGVAHSSRAIALKTKAAGTVDVNVPIPVGARGPLAIAIQLGGRVLQLPLMVGAARNGSDAPAVLPGPELQPPALTSGDQGSVGAEAPTTTDSGTGSAQVPPDTTPPATPTGLTAAGSDEQIALAWDAATDDVGVTGYRVYRQNADGTWPATATAVTDAATRSFTDTGLTNGTAYTYEVTAVDAAGNESPASATAFAAPSAPPCGTAAAPPATWDHVVWIVMENHSYSQIVGDPTAPYETALAGQCGVATNYFAISHPSLPNYIALTSGDTQGITDDLGPGYHQLDVPSIFSQLGPGGWRSLLESMPASHNCSLVDSGLYAIRHNPAAYYTNIRTDCGTYDVRLGSTPDISARFTFIAPNKCNDMHDCPVAAGDDWLKAFIPKLTSTAEYQAGSTAIFLTWDEDDARNTGNRVPTLVISPSTVPGTQSATTFSHYALLHTTEEMLALPFIGGVASAPSMRSGFNLG